MKTVLFTMALAVGLAVDGASLPAWSETAGGDSADVRLETRTGTGGRLVDGTWSVSPRGTADTAGTVAVGDSALETPLSWDTTASADGWTAVTLACGDENLSDSVLVLNSAAVQIHGGRLTADETWDSTRTHVLRNRVVVPSGRTLAISAGAIVKFCESTQILVETGGTLTVTGASDAPVQFAAMANDTVGGDTDMAEKSAASSTYSISVSGTATYNEFVQFHDISIVPGWYWLSLTDCVVSESTKEALVRITLSGSRGVPVTVKWRAVDGTAVHGSDFTVTEGTVSWTASESGMKYIRIPIVSDDVQEGDESFKVELYDAMAALVSGRTCTVRIQDTGLHDEWSAGATAEDVYLDTRRDFGGMLARGTVAVATRGASAADVTPSVGGTTLATPSAFDTTALADGWHDASLPEAAETLNAKIAVLNDSNVSIHGGRLAADESWDAGLVHLVRNNVVVPSGKTLSITAGAVVKLCSGAGIIVESGGKLDIAGTEDALVTLAHAANDGVGGNTDLEDAASVPQNSWSITNNGTFSTNQYVRVLDRSSMPTWYGFSLANCVVAESDGKALVWLNLSGSRSVPVSVGWKAIAGTATETEDYTLASGTVTYGASESGMKYITIPLVKDDIPEGAESFKLQLLDPCGALISGGSCTVTIFDQVVGAANAGATAANVYLDTRSSLGGQLARGKAYFSQVDADEAGAVTLSAGETTTALSNAVFDTAALADGWYVAALGESSKRILILNDASVAVHGGRLAVDETWGKDKTHLVRNWVVIPSGKTLEITEGTVVKCCPGAGFVVENGGTLKANGTADEHVVFTHAGDETIGVSTALNGVTPTTDSYSLTINGTFSVNEYVQIRWRSSVSGWNVVSIQDCVVSELDKVARVRVSLSGSRGVPVTMQWRAVDGTAKVNDDYTLASGSMTWGASESGLKYIEIPLVADSVIEGAENFTVEMLGATAATLSSKTSGTVTVYDQTLTACLGTAGTSADVYLDTRRDFGGMLARGTVHISDTGTYDEASVPMYDGAAIAGYSALDTTAWRDGWYELSLDETDARCTAKIAVLNDGGILVHGGRLTANETWDDGKVHLVRNHVVVPSGITLSITEGAIVKFCTGASLRTEAGGTITVEGTAEKAVAFMHVTDDRLGGDTDLEEATVKTNAYSLVTSGTFTANGYVHVYDSTSFSDWKTVSLADCVVSEYDGVARVRCTLSGQRAYPVTVKWRAVDGTAKYDADYTLKEGTMTWAANTSGMKYIEIPLVHDEIEQGVKTFRVEIADAMAALIYSGTATVSVYDAEPMMNAGHLEVDTTDTWTLDSRPHDFYRYLVDTTQTVRYSTQWAENAGGDCTVRLSYQGDDGEKTAFATYAAGEGEAVWDATQLPESGYTLYHETLDAAGQVVDILTARFHVLRDTVVHTGSVSKNEVWSGDCVHLINGAVTVSGEYTLTIEEGAVIKFLNGSKLWVLTGGAVEARNVIFTHVADDTAGGDTNQDGDGTQPAYGSYSVEGDIRLTDCEVRYTSTLTVDATWSADMVHVLDTIYKVTDGATLTIESGAIVKFATGAGLVASNGGQIVCSGVTFTHIADDTVGGDTNGDGDATSPVHDAYTLEGFTVPTDCDLRYITLTYSGGTIASGETKTLMGGRVHKVTGNITVASGGKLVIQPGAIVKMASGTGITVNSGGTLEAIGNRAEQIVFTSYRDDEHGGDTDKDDGKNAAQPGDWNLIGVAGTLTMEYARIYYGGNTSNGNATMSESGVINGQDGGKISLSRCVIAHHLYDGIFSYASVTAENTAIYECDRGVNMVGGIGRFINCVVDHCRWGIMTEGGTASFINCSITNFYPSVAWTTGWGMAFWSGALSARNCNVWSEFEGTANYRFLFPQSKMISSDPKFTDAENGDFTLQAGSPCIDAGDGTVAPETDWWGKPRMDVVRVANTGTPNSDGICPDIGIYEYNGVSAGPCADMTVTAVEGPKRAVTGDTIAVAWRVENQGDAIATGPWRDTVTLEAADEAMGAQSVELGEVTVSANVDVGGFRKVTGSFVVPPMKSGNWRLAVRTNSYHDVYERHTEDNTAAAETAMRVTLPAWSEASPSYEVEAGGTIGFALPAGDGERLVRVTVPAGASFKAYGANGNVASAENHAVSGVALGDGTVLLRIPAGYDDATVTLENTGDEDATATVSVEDASLAVWQATPAEISNKGTATLQLVCTGVSEKAAVTLSKGATVVKGTVLNIQDGMTLTAQFAMASVAAGSYTLSVSDGGQTASCSAPIVVKAGGLGAQWFSSIQMPSTVRSGRTYAATFEYGNSGDAEMAAPYVRLTNAQGLAMRFAPDEAWSEELEMLAASETYPVSILKPGETRRVKVYFMLPSNVSLASIQYTYTLDDPSDYPWDKNGAAMRPAWATDEAWGHILAFLKTNIGKTWTDYLDRMRADMDHLASLGYTGSRLDQLWQMEVNAALGADGGISELAGGTDLARGGRGMGIALTRSYSAQICRRFRDGAFGMGWTYSYDYSCEMESGYAKFDITYPGGSVRTFTKTGSQWYASQASDKGTMAVNGNLVTITEKGGGSTVYDIKLKRPVSSRDLEDHTVTLTWQDGKLTKVAHSDGQWLKLSYTKYRVTSASDDQGRTVRYEYDASGNLASVTSSSGLVVQYGYNPAKHTADSRALTQIALPDGTTRDYVYDTWGRVVAASVNGTEMTTEVYRDGLGTIRTVAPDGAESVVYSGPYGEVLKTVDAMGHTTTFAYEASTHQMLSIQTPMGHKTSMQYDADQNVSRVLNAAGFATDFTHEGDAGLMTSFTDANGQSVHYAFDDMDRQTAVTYQDGSQEAWTYDDATGDARTWTNRRGQTVTCTYDGEGRTATKTWPDGRTFTYAYDAKGNTTRISDSETGDIAVEYDEREWVTKVTYPKNRWFAFQRDAIGRVTARTAFDGHVLTVAYDELGRAFRWTDGKGNLYKENAYDEITGRLLRVTNGNGTYTTYGYDLLGRNTAIEHHQADGTVFASFTYTYNADGQRVAMATKNGRHTYTYDLAGQLLQAAYPDGTTDAFSYDPVGNRLTAGNGSYVKNALNQYTQAGQDSFTYDADGNMASWTTPTGTTTYEYDILNRLTKVVRPDGSVWSCQYDAVGNRISVTDCGKTRETVYLGGVYADFENGAETARYLGGITECGTAVRYWHSDGLASVRAITDGSGTVVGTQDYDVCGRVSAAAGETTEFGFVGMGDVRLDATGLLFMQNRYYAIPLGRFIQCDPIGIDAGDVNFYRYCGNDGVNGVDPSGLEEKGYVCGSLNILTVCGGQDANGDFILGITGGLSLGLPGDVSFGTGTLSEGWTATGYVGIPLAGGVEFGSGKKNILDWDEKSSASMNGAFHLASFASAGAGYNFNCSKILRKSKTLFDGNKSNNTVLKGSVNYDVYTSSSDLMCPMPRN